MKEYTLNEAKEIVGKVLDKCGADEDRGYKCACGGLTCINCFFYSDTTPCRENILNNKCIEKAEQFLLEVN